MTVASALANRVARAGARTLLGTRRWSDAAVAEIAGTGHGLRVLEIGSGRQDLGENAFSLAPALPDADFLQSDVDPRFGHRIVDVTRMDFDAEFDLILCMYVLEHVYAVDDAVAHLHRAVRPSGRVIIAVPHVYPYHDEPIDFWRFTEYSLRTLCRDFADVEIRHKGIRRFPKALLAVARR